MNFFVAALPRSRTAWLSCFLAQSGRSCLHDGFNGCHNMTDYVLKLGDGGDSSTGLTLIDINAMFPGSPVVIIDKTDDEFEKCVKWCDKTYNMNSRESLMNQRESLEYIDGLRINQSDIDDRLEEIFTYLTGCEYKPYYSNMRRLNIQCDPFDIDFKAADIFLNERSH